MVIVILAGGSGTRLWPLSTPENPKHLLKLVDEESLLQSAYNRAKQLANDVYVITEKSHADKVKEQLPGLNKESLVIEPDRRGTMSCILAGLCRVSRLHNSDEPIAFIHADHVIRNTKGFVNSFKSAATAAVKYGKIVLVGVRPSYAATGFGYIKMNGQIDQTSVVQNVAEFKEKPTKKIAEKYVRSGEYLWNCGYFVGSVDIFENAIKKFSPEWEERFNSLLSAKDEIEFNKIYLSLEKETIDYALIERDTELLVIPATFDWMDLGSYGDIYDAVDKDENANYINGENIETVNVTGSYVSNKEPNKRIGVVGLSNIIVVNTVKGLIIAHRDMSQSVREIAEAFKDK